MLKQSERSLQKVKSGIVYATSLVAVLCSLSCAETLSLEAQTAAALGLVDGTEREFASEAGVMARVVVSRLSDDEELPMRFYQEVTLGGFLDDTYTQEVFVSAQELFITSFSDCITRCGAAEPPIAVLSSPLDPGDVSETETTLTSGIAPDLSERDEVHRFVVGDSESITVGSEDVVALPLYWTHPDGVAAIHYLPDVGMVRFEAGGVQYTATEITRTVDDDSTN